ncbi:MAG TPA: N-carbamoylputrescine amidase [Rhodospirillaceae bacterium]|nr:N-carbamoylputrescine amidase [Candidatus Neomarinimicrobiota bacterium]HCX14595.1 N-carbamoylputrescine amidase [Rhodospirillaceae bacterium]
MSAVTVAAIQCAFSENLAENIERTSDLIEQGANRGANIILPPELLQGRYFCVEEKEKHFDSAFPADKHPVVSALAMVAKKLKVVIPASIFERDGQHYYNSLAMIDADGEVLGTYRKSHIPDGPGYEEKFYFRPGNTGFRAWPTKFGKIGVGICWDQWFPEAARAMMLLGADILFYPTAIGSEPDHPEFDTKMLWQRAMVGHAVSNMVSVVAANRTGTENGQVFYGSSFITDQCGEILQEMGRYEEGVITAKIDINEARRNRAAFGFFRDRRPDLYKILTNDK